jgi:hypothetical protein
MREVSLDYISASHAGAEHLSFRRNAFVKSVHGGGVQKTTIYNIHSVATPVDVLRRCLSVQSTNPVGQGHATHLLRLLHYCLADPFHLPAFPAEWGSAPHFSPEDRNDVPFGIASSLYSDVGCTFYERCTIGRDLPGWIMRDEENQEVVWRIQPPLTAEGGEWHWLYEADLYSDTGLLEDVRNSALARLQQIDTSLGPAFLADPASPYLLGDVATRCLDIRPLNWPYSRNTEPVGVRLEAKDPSQPDAIVIFSWSTDMIGWHVFLLHTANLTADLVPDALAAMDVVGHAAGLQQGWMFGPGKDDDFTLAVKALPDRLVRTGRRAEIDGHLLAVAWYGGMAGEGQNLDLDLLQW